MAAADNTLEYWLTTLPHDEQRHYRDLIARLQQAGDPEKLSSEERQELADMANRFAGRSAESGSNTTAPSRGPAAATVTSRPTIPSASQPTIQPINSAFLQTEFVAYVREVLNRDWCARGGTLQDAVLHAFEQKWLPDELRDEATCANLYRRYQRDIDQANGFRQGLAGNQTLAGDKRMAVGLAWFTTVYKMNQLLLQGIDPDS